MVTTSTIELTPAVEECGVSTRREELRRLLTDAYERLAREIHDPVRDDLDAVLLQMKAETLNKIDEALRRYREGTYGFCIDCGGDIAASRLRALLFAVRCKQCEESGLPDPVARLSLFRGHTRFTAW